MPKLDRPGKFRATVGDYGFRKSEAGDSKAFAMVLRFDITHALIEGKWEDWSQYGMSIFKDHYFVNKNGEPIEHGVEVLRDTLKWSGDSNEITEKLWSPPSCRITVEEEDYTNKEGQSSRRLNVKWINPDAVGIKSNVESADLQTLNAVAGPQLRAMFGAQPSSVKKPAGKPTSPAPKSSASAPASGIAMSTMDKAWNAFNAANDAGNAPGTPEQVQHEWFRIMNELCGKTVNQMNGADWYKMEHEGIQLMKIPF